MNYTVDARHTWAQQGAGGCKIDMIPFVTLFPPLKSPYRRDKWTIHFGWLYWTVVVHF